MKLKKKVPLTTDSDIAGVALDIHTLNVGQAFAVESFADNFDPRKTGYQQAQAAYESAMMRWDHQQDAEGFTERPKPACLSCNDRTVTFGWGRSQVTVSWTPATAFILVDTPKDSVRYQAAVWCGCRPEGV